MKKALITGITGQDGSYLAELLLAKGYKVVGVYRRSSVPTFGRIEHLIGRDNFSLACGDITDYSSINTILTKERPDEVYNLAAQSHVGVSFSQPILTWDVTAVGCMNILESLRHLQDDKYKPRFYQASSSEMFGDAYTDYAEKLTLCYDKESTDYKWDVSSLKYQNEDTPMNPQSPYAVAKLAAHKMTTLYRKYGLFTASGILFNHESPRRGENFVTRKITRYVGELVNANMDIDKFDNVHFEWVQTKLKSREKLVLPAGQPLKLGNLDACRDWGFAGDYVEAMWLMLQQETGDDFVVATGETKTVREFCDYAFGAIGLDWQKYVVVDQEFVRPAEVPYLRGDYGKAKRVLGWKPKHDFRALAEMMVKADISEAAV